MSQATKIAIVAAFVAALGGISNEASARVLVKNGFEQEGYFRRHFLKEGELIDTRAFGRLR